MKNIMDIMDLWIYFLWILWKINCPQTLNKNY